MDTIKDKNELNELWNKKNLHGKIGKNFIKENEFL